MLATRALMIIIVVAVLTFATRLLPFIIFNRKKEVSKTVRYLGDILPKAVMAILIIYCLKDVNMFKIKSFAPSILAMTAVGLIHIWKRNNLISIGAGTLIYMILVQVVFK